MFDPHRTYKSFLPPYLYTDSHFVLLPVLLLRSKPLPPSVQEPTALTYRTPLGRTNPSSETGGPSSASTKSPLCSSVPALKEFGTSPFTSRLLTVLSPHSKRSTQDPVDRDTLGRFTHLPDRYPLSAFSAHILSGSRCGK